MKTSRITFTLLLYVLLFLTCTSFVASPTALKYLYNIIYKGKKIGQLSLLQQKNQNHQFISIHTKASIKRIFTVDVTSRDEAMFDRGVMVWSSTYREVNGKEHENKKTTLNNSAYELLDGSARSTFNGVITGNMINLYVKEPASDKQVYSDSHQQFVDIRKTASHTYAISLPDGNTNTYEYTNNVCSKVKINTQFYDISFELVR